MPPTPSILQDKTVRVMTKADIADLAVVIGKQNIIPWRWYDTVQVANGNSALSLSFFAQTRGAAGLPVTNMEQPNQLISGKVFVLEAIELDINPAGAYAAGSLADMVALTHVAASFTLKINQVEYAQGPVKALIGNGLAGFGTPATINQYATANLPARGVGENPGIVIPTQTQFSLEFNYSAAPNPAATQLLRPSLIGQLIRLTSA